MKALSLRLDDRLSRQFDAVCSQLGYKKNTILTRMIAAFVQHKQNISSTMGKKQPTKPDPFLSVIGIIDSPNGETLLPSDTDGDDIDKIVYNL